jgi:predicted extracellular nuclease
MKIFLAYFVTLVFSITTLYCSEPSKGKEINSSSFYVANWNVENLFDTMDDPNKFDESFTPNGDKNWTEDKLNQKLENLAKVISQMNNGRGPDILGLEEVENESVLNSLLNKISLKKNYRIIHEESPDKRGIDNAIIYNSDLFTLKHSDAIEVKLKNDKTTRDILYSLLEVNDQQLHIFVNHWSSRRGGLKKTEGLRKLAAETLLNKVEGFNDLNNANIIILGDFNDLPSNISISKILGARELNCSDKITDSFSLFNLTYEEFQKGNGTYKYRDHWNMLDQIIISNSLVDKKGIDFKCESFEIFKPDYIIQQSGKYKGTSLPTYGGKNYLGGFSDHFSIGAEFYLIIGNSNK